MNQDKIIEKIKAGIPFKQEEFDLFARHLSLVVLKKNEIWEKEGDTGQLMGFINKGILRQYYIKEELEFTEQFFSEGDFIGNYVSYLKKEPSRTNIQALEPCELLVISFDKLQELYDQVPAIDRFGRLTAEQILVKIHDRNTSFLMDSPEQRYDNLIEEKPELLSRVPQYYIAQYLGIRAESLSRIRKRKRGA